jgi:hypothetical protein
MGRYCNSVSVFSSNTVTRGKGAITSNISGSNAAIQRSFTLNAILKEVLNLLNVYLNYYIVGDIDTLNNLLTSQQYLLLSNTLINMPFTDNTNVDLVLIRDGALKTLATLRGALFHAQNYRYIEEQYENAKERNQILDDVDKLREYIDELNHRLYNPDDIDNERLFVGQITAIAPTIDGTYLTYIKHFGYPQNSIFDPILLNKIQNGEIT